jgi:metal-dependent amidase/aminoacylase/carboxypeptidase family protein
VKIEGTFRALDESWRTKAHELIERMATHLVEGMGGTVDLDIRKGYPYLENNPSLTRRSRKRAEQYMGAENIVDLDIWMAGEDFAFYTHHVDGCFYRLGTGNPGKGISSSVHTPTFDIDEDALAIAPGLMSWLAIQELSGT